METYIVRINGTQYEVEIEKKAGGQSSGRQASGGQTAGAPSASAQESTGAGTSQPAAASGSGEPVVCGTAGKVWKIEKNVGQQVEEGDPVIILEAMKMEIPVVAPKAGSVSGITVQEGDAVESGQTVAYVE